MTGARHVCSILKSPAWNPMVGSFPGSARAASQFDAVFFEQSSAKKGDCFLTKIYGSNIAL